MTDCTRSIIEEKQWLNKRWPENVCRAVRQPLISILEIPGSAIVRKGDIAAWRWWVINRQLSGGCAGSGTVRVTRKVSLARLTTGGMMRVHRAVAVSAAIALNIFAVGVLGTSTALAATGETAAPASVTAAGPDEMGYNGVSPDEMGYN